MCVNTKRSYLIALDDCFWDFVQCTEFEDRRCCDDRYYSCCQWIMQGMAMSSNFVEPPASTSTTTTTTTTTPKPYQHADSLSKKTLVISKGRLLMTFSCSPVGCIWQFNSCVQARFRGGDESVCYLRYDDCKMIVMGMMPMQQDQEFANELPSPINMMNGKFFTHFTIYYLGLHKYIALFLGISGVATTQKPRPLPAETSQTKPRPRITLSKFLI